MKMDVLPLLRSQSCSFSLVGRSVCFVGKSVAIVVAFLMTFCGIAYKTMRFQMFPFWYHLILSSVSNVFVSIVLNGNTSPKRNHSSPFIMKNE